MDIRSIIDTVVDTLYNAFTFIVENPLYILVILAAIIVYAIAHYILFKAKGYQPVDRAMCTLSMTGKERSLEFLQNFTHMSQEQIAIIQYLRKNEPVSRAALNKRFGKQNVDILIRKEYILLT